MELFLVSIKTSINFSQSVNQGVVRVDGSHGIVLCRLCIFAMRSSSFVRVSHSNQPRYVNRSRLRVLLPSIRPVSVKYSSFPFWPRNVAIYSVRLSVYHTRDSRLNCLRFRNIL